MSDTNRQDLSTAMTVIANHEGLTVSTASMLSDVCKREHCHCLCLQETHKAQHLARPKITGMRPKITGMTLIVSDPASSMVALFSNPKKTQVTVFHLRNKEAKKSLKVVWNETELENTTYPKYLGVTLDRSASYKQHIQNTKMKLATHNNLLTTMVMIQIRLQTTQPTSGGAVTADSSCCANCVEPPRPQQYNITLTTSQVQEAIKQSKNNNSQGPDKLNSRHLKHIGPLGLAFLRSMFKTALNNNIIPHTWKLANT